MVLALKMLWDYEGAGTTHFQSPFQGSVPAASRVWGREWGLVHGATSQVGSSQKRP